MLITNRCIKIAGEKLLNFSGSGDLLWSHIRQFRPQLSRFIAYEICLFVAASSRFLFWNNGRWLKDWLRRHIFLVL